MLCNTFITRHFDNPLTFWSMDFAKRASDTQTRVPTPTPHTTLVSPGLHPQLSRAADRLAFPRETHPLGAGMAGEARGAVREAGEGGGVNDVVPRVHRDAMRSAHVQSQVRNVI